MAWNGAHDFNGESDGDLNGTSGGTGWAAAWSGPTGFDIQGTTTFEGAKAVVATSGSGGDRIVRAVTTGESTGIIYVAGRYTTSNLWQMTFRSAGTFCGIVREVSGNIQLFNNVTLTNIENSTVSSSTWFELYVEYDCSTDQYRAKLGSAPSGSWYTFFAGNTASTIDEVTLDHQNTPSANIWFDDVRSGSGGGGGGSSFVPRVSFIM